MHLVYGKKDFIVIIIVVVVVLECEQFCYINSSFALTIFVLLCCVVLTLGNVNVKYMLIKIFIFIISYAKPFIRSRLHVT